MKGAGGTPGGLGTFFVGVIMAVAGFYLLASQVQVSSGFWGYRWSLFGGTSVSAFGVMLIPFLLGVGLIFFDAGSRAGWLLAVGSLVIILIGIITNLQVYFAPTSLFITLVIMVLLVGGLGLIGRSLRPFA